MLLLSKQSETDIYVVVRIIRCIAASPVAKGTRDAELDRTVGCSGGCAKGGMFGSRVCSRVGGVALC